MFSLGSCTVNDTCTIYCLICYPITNSCSLPHISAHNGDCKIYMRVTWLKKQIIVVQYGAPCWAQVTISDFGFSFWRCELLLRPISRTRILFIPMTLLQQTIKMRMCNREITAVGFHNLPQCRLCEFWLWLLQHCKWCLNVCCHFCRAVFHVLSHCCIENKTKQRHWRAQNCCG